MFAELLDIGICHRRSCFLLMLREYLLRCREIKHIRSSLCCFATMKTQETSKSSIKQKQNILWGIRFFANGYWCQLTVREWHCHVQLYIASQLSNTLFQIPHFAFCVFLSKNENRADMKPPTSWKNDDIRWTHPKKTIDRGYIMTGGSSLRCLGRLVVEADFIKYLHVLHTLLGSLKIRDEVS